MLGTNWAPLLVTCFIAIPGVACFQSSEEGASGLQRDDDVGALSAAETADLCAWGEQVGAVTGAETDCGDEVVVAPTLEECRQYMAEERPCVFTVGDVEACWLAMVDDTCANYRAPVCAAPPGCE